MKALLLVLASASVLAPAQAAPNNPPPIATTKVAPATILSVKMIKLNQPDPALKGEHIDVFVITVRNDTSKNFVRATLFGADKNGTPSYWPAVLKSVPTAEFVASKPWVWQVSLKPGYALSIRFVARSLSGVYGYCTGVNNAIWWCTNH